MKNISILSSGSFRAAALFIVLRKDRAGNSIVAARLFDGSLINLKAVVGGMTYPESYRIDGRNYPLHGSTCRDGKTSVFLSKMRKEYAWVHTAFYASPVAQNVIFGENSGDIEDGLFDLLMKKTTLPLKKEWSGYIMGQLEKEGRLKNDIEVVTAVEGMTFTYQGRSYSLDKLIGVSFMSSIDDALIERIIKQGIRDREISITPSGKPQTEMILTDLDTYRLQYGGEFVQNVKKLVKPFMPLKGGVEESFLCGDKRLYKQQGAIVNAVADNFFHHREPSMLLIEQMGSGKSIQALAAIEETESLRWLSSHPGMTPADAHATAGNINYRVMIMPPGHLVEKWGQEIRENIPFAKVKLIENLADMEEIRKKGAKRNGKEFYIIGKDLCKLSCSEIPVPTRVKEIIPVTYECRSCGHEYSAVSVKKMISDGKPCGCQKAEGAFIPKSFNDFRRCYHKGMEPERGLVCESCGNILTDAKGDALLPQDFLNKTSANEICRCCGAAQWRPNVKTIGESTKSSPWVKMSFYKNLKKKDRETGWVLKGYEQESYLANGIVTSGLDVAKEPKLRKWSPAQFAKTKLKGYFDFAIFDELHQYKSGESAQANAMHSIASITPQCIGLTGTIAGGYASDLFFMLWRLAPHIMKEAGYTYIGETGLPAFVAKYGTIETVYEAVGSVRSNKCSKGRQTSSPKYRPGISPDIFGDMLMPVAVFLDLTDMSAKLPPLKEQVIPIEMDGDVREEYEGGISALRTQAAGKAMCAASSEMLLYSLLYCDLPCGYKERILDTEAKTMYIPHIFPKNRVYAKEQKLIELVNAEMDEDRNCFIYIDYTGKEFELMPRLKSLLQEYCGLEDNEVVIMESQSPAAAKREAYIHKKAAAGAKVFICNPKLVETGLDFTFKHEGKKYNYPTLIFYEMGMSLFTLWQASRRAYRLCQTEECRTYYLCYENTNQARMVRLMAEKQIATSSIQGKFSMEGLTAMAQSVDPRLILTQVLMEAAERRDDNDAEKASSIFQNLNESTGLDESVYGESQTLLFSEVYGKDTAAEEENEVFQFMDVIDTVAAEIPDAVSVTDVQAEDDVSDIFGISFTSDATSVKEEPVEEEKEAVPSFLEEFFDGFGIPSDELGILKDAAEAGRKVRTKKSIVPEGQLSIFDLFSA